MTNAAELVSPKQVARAIGVSESSLKRWCDQGLIKTVRTVGGHRKLPVSDVLRFLRERDVEIISPEVLGLPPVSERAERGLSRGRPQLVEALLAGDELLARQIIFDLHLAKHRLSVIFDTVVAPAFGEIGDRWACQELDVYRERRSCELMLRILLELRRFQDLSDRPHLAIGGTIEGDPYTLPTTMTEMVVRDCGFKATSLGSSIPVPSLIRAVQELKPSLFWLSVSSLPDEARFREQFSELSQACEATGTALVVGGRVLHESLRQQLCYSAFCDTMQHLESFAKTLIRSLNKSGSTDHGKTKQPVKRSRGAQRNSL